MMSKPQPYRAQAPIVYYDRPRKFIVLCDTHRQPFYSLHPEAFGCGEWRPAEECEYCKFIKEGR